jgi:hypothetical protein
MIEIEKKEKYIIKMNNQERISLLENIQRLMKDIECAESECLMPIFIFKKMLHNVGN